MASDLLSIHFSFHSNFFASWPISMAGGGTYKLHHPFPFLTLPSSVGLGSLSSTTLRYLGSGDKYAKKLGKKYFFKETCAIMPPTRGFRFKNKNFGGFSPSQEAANTILDTGSQGCCISRCVLGKRYPQNPFPLRSPRLLHNLDQRFCLWRKEMGPKTQEEPKA